MKNTQYLFTFVYGAINVAVVLFLMVLMEMFIFRLRSTHMDLMMVTTDTVNTLKFIYIYV